MCTSFPNGFLFGNLNNFKNISEFWNVFVVSKHYEENVTEIHAFELISLFQENEFASEFNFC